MQYTKNFGNKLLNRGFKFKYNHADAEINYDVYENGCIDITVDHTNKEIVVDLLVDSETIELSSFSHLESLISLLKSMKLNVR